MEASWQLALQQLGAHSHFASRAVYVTLVARILAATDEARIAINTQNQFANGETKS
jgi:hypothetical protein